MKQRYPIIGAVIAAAVTGGLIYYSTDNQPSAADDRTPLGGHNLTSRSAAYQFGFVHAAMSGCSFKPGETLDEFSALVERNAEGIVPDDLKAGFTEFARLLEADGASGACSLAEQLFGPRGDLRPGILKPR